jgi:catechol 2,3-dioxygenase-like lactoylglutathione lyase family enzyme
MIEGISHVTFIVHDLEKSAAFFREILEAQEVYSSEGREFSVAPEKFFLVGGMWIALMQGKPTEKTYNHIAFKIPDEQFDRYVEKVRESGVEIKPPRPRIEGEGQSLYFYDYDNHLFEIHTGTLDQRLQSYARQSGKQSQAA